MFDKIFINQKFLKGYKICLFIIIIITLLVNISFFILKIINFEYFLISIIVFITIPFFYLFGKGLLFFIRKSIFFYYFSLIMMFLLSISLIIDLLRFINIDLMYIGIKLSHVTLSSLLIYVILKVIYKYKNEK